MEALIPLIGILFPVLIVGLSLGYAAVHRYLTHKERMAMIEKGIAPSDLDDNAMPRPYRGRSSLSRGITILAVGVALTIGLLTLGVGPWLLGGLIPMAVGGAILLSHYLSEDESGKDGTPRE